MNKQNDDALRGLVRQAHETDPSLGDFDVMAGLEDLQYRAKAVSDSASHLSPAADASEGSLAHPGVSQDFKSTKAPGRPLQAWPGARLTHRMIVVVDIASFTDSARTLLDQRTVHEGLYWILRTAFDESGIDLEACHVEDRGDGALVLLPPEIPKTWLVDRLPARLLSGLREHNAVHTAESQIQLRVALHAGEAYQNTNGVVSQAVNLAFRILDADPAKSALAASGGMLAVIASNDFYHNVVQHEPAADPASYRRIAVSVKQFEAVAWLRLPEVPPAVAKQLQTTSVMSAEPPGQLVRPNAVIFAVVEALLELPFVREVNGRQMLIDMLRPEIATAVPYQSSARLHAYALVSTCIRHEHGLAELFEAVRRLDGGSIAVRRLEAIERAQLPGSVD